MRAFGLNGFIPIVIVFTPLFIEGIKGAFLYHKKPLT